MKIKQISGKITRVFEENKSMLSRYGILKDGAAEASELNGNSLSLSAGKRELTINFNKSGKGFEINIPLSKTERIFGGGDATKEGIMHRGRILDMDVRNVVSYGPIPYFMSTDGWAILVNCTYNHIFDIGKTDTNTMRISAEEGVLDFYIFCGDNMAELLSLYTDISGKPIMLPKYAYGFSMCENDECNAYTLLQTCRSYRDYDIPCDIISLEPGWMEKFYDYTTDKKWSKDRFGIPYWLPDNQGGKRMFTFPMREMGMNLSLWLCEDYDIFYEEEGNCLRSAEASYAGAEIIDEHFGKEKHIDTITDANTPWFEHLKKFVDNGASGFKLDAADQVLYHPDRLWGGKFLDAEAHNAYPVVLAKQMQQGFKNHTDRRAFIFTPDSYAGTQQYAASWTGDVGGGYKTVPAIFNYSMCAHSHLTCDMDFLNPMAIHYGFLLPISQMNNWAQWLYPWFLAKEREDMIRFYSKLRSSLFPYIYAMAHKANKTAMPMVRPLSLVYEETDRFDNTNNLYMFGDNLLVGVFDMHLNLPEGVWIDYFTGDEYEGTIDYKIPEGKGGALFVKKGSVIFTMAPQKYLMEKEHSYEICIYPGADNSTTLVEDDGLSYDYESGKVATTKAFIKNSTEQGFDFVLEKREGSFKGKPDNGHHHIENTIPEISGMAPISDITVKMFDKKALNVFLGDEKINAEFNGNVTTFVVPAEKHEQEELSYKIMY